MCTVGGIKKKALQLTRHHKVALTFVGFGSLAPARSVAQTSK